MIKKIPIFSFLIVSLFGYSQTHSIDESIINLSDDASVSDFYANTFYNAYNSVNISWQIIESDMPDQWSFSNCFPNCYNPGVLSGSNSFLPNSQQYLNCHFYPNNTSGTGVVKMEIITNNQFIDTVTWIGVANSTSEISEFIQNITFNRNVSIYDITGKKLEKLRENKLNIVVDQNGIIKKYFYVVK